MFRYLFIILFLFSCQFAYGDTIDGIEGVELEIAQWDAIAAPSVAPVNTGRIYYNGTSDTLKASLNGGSYFDLITSNTVPPAVTDYWKTTTAQTGLTGNKSGSFGLTTTGLINTGEIIVSNPTVPANPNSAGTTGTVAWDSSYIYVCVSTDSWVRYAKATWTSIPPASGMPIGMMMGLLYE
jgi:hypothetical protein